MSEDSETIENIVITCASKRINPILTPCGSKQKIYTPGEIIGLKKDMMRGHGTHEHEEHLKSSVAGVVQKIDKLVSMKPLKCRYTGEVGDVVVGRIKELHQKRWKVDTNARLDSNLLLSSVNLPGGELRRRSAEDQHMMRKYLQEGDLISAEVQSVFHDGSLSLHTRSLKYGKLSQGVLVKVIPALIKRTKTRFHNLPMGVSIILGKNGYIWISPTINADEENLGGFFENADKVVPLEERQVIVRLRNCILALAKSKITLFPTSIMEAYELSLKYDLAELLLPDVMYTVALHTQAKMNMLEDL